MNEENLNYLKDNVKFMGFGEKLHADLTKSLEEGKPDFVLRYQTSVNGKEFTADLQFRKAENLDRYYFNRYKASLAEPGGESKEQTFYIDKGKGVTAKEAFNLLEGRSVFKELSNKEGNAYNAWIQLDMNSRDKNGNFPLKQYHQNYGYDMGRALVELPLRESLSDEQRMALVKSLEKGNRQAVTMEVNGKEERRYIEANPQYKTINQYDEGGNRIRRSAGKEINQTPDVRTAKGEKKETGKNKNADEVKEEKGQTESLLPKKRTRNKGLHP